MKQNSLHETSFTTENMIFEESSRSLVTMLEPCDAQRDLCVLFVNYTGADGMSSQMPSGLPSWQAPHLSVISLILCSQFIVLVCHSTYK